MMKKIMAVIYVKEKSDRNRLPDSNSFYGSVFKVAIRDRERDLVGSFLKIGVLRISLC